MHIGAKHGHDVPHGSAVERRDDADFAREKGQWTLAGRREQALRLQPAFQLVERDLQRPRSGRLETIADELILALDVVHAHAAARDHLLAVFDAELETARRRSEHHRPDLRPRILQREVDVARRPGPAVRDLAFDGYARELGLEHPADVARELADGQDRGARRRRRLDRRRRAASARARVPRTAGRTATSSAVPALGSPRAPRPTASAGRPSRGSGA